MNQELKTKNKSSLKVGSYVIVHRKKSKEDIGPEEGIICYVPPHKKFFQVQFFKQPSGKPLYKQRFFASDLERVRRPRSYQGRIEK